MRSFRVLILLGALCGALGVTNVGCHADKDDPAGQAGELADAQRRQNALVNIRTIYGTKLREQEGNTAAPEVTAIADKIIQPLVDVYISAGSQEDTRTGLEMLRLMEEMRDPRTIPAMITALKWRAEVTELHAVTAAKALRKLEIPADQRVPVITAVGEALGRVNGKRGDDNKMRKAFIELLGHMGGPEVIAPITQVATNISENQDFVFNQLAMQELGNVQDPSVIPTLIKGLFIFDPANPQKRADSWAVMGLIKQGRAAYEPLLNVLRGQDESVKPVITAFINSLRERNVPAESLPTVAQEMAEKGAMALGQLGLVEGLDPILQETNHENWRRSFNAAIQLVPFRVDAEGKQKVRAALQRVFGSLPEGPMGLRARGQIMANMQRTFDPGFLPFFLERSKNEAIAPLRIGTVQAYAMLANKTEAARLKAWIDGIDQDNGDANKATYLRMNNTALALAEECDEDIACYATKLGTASLGDQDQTQVAHMKAAYMLGRLGVDDGAAINALVECLGHTDLQIRGVCARAVDKTAGSAALAQTAIAKIDALEEAESGRGIWTQFKDVALRVRARLTARLGS